MYVWGSNLAEEILYVKANIKAIENNCEPEDLATLGEYRMYLAKLEKEDAKNSKALKVKSSTVRQGTGCTYVFRCPACEQALWSKVSKCPNCKQELRWT